MIYLPVPALTFFSFNQNISFLTQSNLQSTRPTNHRITFALKQRCSHFFLPLHCKTFLSKTVSVWQLPVWKLLHKTHMHCGCSTVFYHPTQWNDWNKKRFWQPAFSKSLVTFKNHSMYLSLIFKTAAFHDWKLLHWGFLVSLHPSAWLHSIRRNSRKDVILSNYNYCCFFLYPLLRLPEATATSDRLMLCPWCHPPTFAFFFFSKLLGIRKIIPANA